MTSQPVRRHRELREVPATDQAIRADAAPAAPRRAPEPAAPAGTVAGKRADSVKER
jgi:hypothetical protein